jgi:hypothetical protein
MVVGRERDNKEKCVKVAAKSISGERSWDGLFDMDVGEGDVEGWGNGGIVV